MRIGGKTCNAALGVAGIFFSLLSSASAVPVKITYGDSAGEGFYDPTLGNERRIAFEFAVDRWASRLDGTVPITIKASFDNLGEGDPVVLGRAGANYIHRDFPGAPQTRTWYDDPLANQYRTRDLVAAEPDIEAVFNNQVDTLNALSTATFYYGLDERVPSDKVSFVRLVMHEICHGLGFATVIKSSDGSMPDNFPSAYDKLLIHHNGVSWRYIYTLTDGERYNTITSEYLFFNGDATYESHGALPPMFAPSQPYPGSSISHFDYKRYEPSQLMEPVLFGSHLNPGLADDVLDDIGWEVAPLPRIAFKGRRPSPSEDEGIVQGSSGYAVVSLSSPAVMDTFISFTSSGINGAEEGHDYLIETASPLIIPKGASSAAITIHALSIPEATVGKAVQLTLDDAEGGELSLSGRSVTIELINADSSVNDWVYYE